MATGSLGQRPHTPDQAWPRYEDVVNVESRWSYQDWQPQIQSTSSQWSQNVAAHGHSRNEHRTVSGDLKQRSDAAGSASIPDLHSSALSSKRPFDDRSNVVDRTYDSRTVTSQRDKHLEIPASLHTTSVRKTSWVSLDEHGVLPAASSSEAIPRRNDVNLNSLVGWPSAADFDDEEIEDDDSAPAPLKRRREEEFKAAVFGPCSNTWTVPALKPRRKKKATGDLSAPKHYHRFMSAVPPKSRGRLLGQDREETALTRQIKACVRCRMQKNRCEPDPEDITRPCLRCQRLAEPALAVLPCLRYIITDASLYREQEAPYQMFSQRWQTMDILDIEEWASDEIRVIEISHLFHYAPYRAKMRKFVPVEGDMITEVWTDRQGNVRTHDIPPYAIADMKEHINVVRQFIDRNVSEYIVAVVDRLDPLLWNTYMQAFRHIGSAKEERERNLMGNAFRLWAACRSTSNECRIAGTDTLDVPIVTDPSSPWYLHIPPPPILVAQEECIYYTKLLRPLSKKVLDELQNLMLGNKKKHWLTIYLVTFILLHSCSMITRRDAECAAKWSLPCEYANPHAIAGHHMGALTLLAHFHYSCKGKRPFTMALEEEGLEEVVKSCSLSADETQFVRESADLVRRRQRMMRHVRQHQLFGHDLFWISQLYDTDWEPSARYI